MTFKVLGISGSMHPNDKTSVLVERALEAAKNAGAETELVKLGELDLPVFVVGKKDLPSQVTDIRRKVTEAHAFIVGTPEYHGSMSGALKNFFDYHYFEFGGKLFGIVLSTGGGQGVSAAMNVRSACQYCHGWVLPYQAAAEQKDFNEKNELLNEKVQDRLIRMGRDLVTYGKLLITEFKKELESTEEKVGFAAWHMPRKK